MTSQFQARALPSVRSVAREQWDALSAGSPFGWNFCLAAEAAPPPGFQISALGVFSRGTLIAAAPVFQSHYRLDMSLPERLRGLGDRLHRVAPRLLNLPVLGLGSPLMDRCPVGLHPSLRDEERSAAWSALVTGVQDIAAERGIQLLAVKDLAEHDEAAAASSLQAARFTRLASLPVAVLDLPFVGETEYLASLSGSMRRDLKRKLRQSQSGVRFEVRSSIADVEQQVVELYAATRAQSPADYGEFDSLSPAYFGEVLTQLGERARIVLGWVGNELASFAMYLIGKDSIFAHQIGMRYPLAREHNLYFLNWMLMVRICLERGIRRLEFGQTSYAQKLRLGCRLEKSAVYFKHRLAAINGVLGLVAPLVAFDKMEQAADTRAAAA